MLSVRYELQPYTYIILPSKGQSVSLETTENFNRSHPVVL